MKEREVSEVAPTRAPSAEVEEQHEDQQAR